MPGTSEVCVTQARCARAREHWSREAEWQYCAISLITAAAGRDHGFVHHVDVTSEVLDCAKMGKVGSTHAGKRALHY